MKHIKLTQQELADISEAIELPETKQRFRRKLLAVKMVAANIARKETCSVLGITAATLCSYIDEFLSGGLAACLEDCNYRPSSRVEEYLEKIAEYFRANPPGSSKEAADSIAQLCGVRLSDSQARRLMAKRLGMRFRKAGTRSGKADDQMQLDFFENELQPRLEQAEAGERRVYFLDASHFVWGSFADYCWSFQRVWTHSACGRKRHIVLGALDAIDKSVRCIHTDGTINSETVASLLIDLRIAHRYEPISVVLDNVPYHRSSMVREVAICMGIELVYLPPYSPNLNLIERLWKWVKKQALSNATYQTYDEFKQAIQSCIQRATGENRETIRTLLSLNFQFFSS